VLALKGPLRVYSIGNLDTRLDSLGKCFTKVDLSQVSEIDTAGAWLAWRVAHDCEAEIVGASDLASRLMAAVGQVGDRKAEPPQPLGPFRRIFEGVGATVTAWGAGLVRVVGFLGALLLAFGSVIRHPGRFRTKAL